MGTVGGELLLCLEIGGEQEDHLISHCCRLIVDFLVQLYEQPGSLVGGQIPADMSYFDGTRKDSTVCRIERITT